MNELFGERLRRLRKARGISTAAVAERVGVSTVAVCHWEIGGAKPYADNLRVLARMMGVSVDFLLTGHEAPQLAALHHAIRAGASNSMLLAMVREQERP